MPWLACKCSLLCRNCQETNMDLSITDRYRRDSLLDLCNTNISTRAVAKQLSIALADLAIQMTSDSASTATGGVLAWADPVGFMIDNFGGGGPDHLAILLEFLTVLPEELATNQKITMDVRSFYDLVF